VALVLSVAELVAEGALGCVGLAHIATGVDAVSGVTAVGTGDKRGIGGSVFEVGAVSASTQGLASD
jgi:hypothetical protein